MAAVSKLLSSDPKQVAHDLWGVGYRVTRRSHDPFDIPAAIVPAGFRYEWVNSVDVAARYQEGWTFVQFDRHDGWLAPLGTKGDAEVQGMRLMRIESAKVTEEKDRIAKALAARVRYVQQAQLMTGAQTQAEVPPVSPPANRGWFSSLLDTLTGRKP